MTSENGTGDGSIGLIYGDVGTDKFQAVATGELHRRAYVMVQHPECGPCLAQVDALERKTNLTAEKADKLARNELVEINERIIADISVVGYRDHRNLLQVPHTPFLAGEKVYPAPDDLIRSVVGLKDDPSKGAYLGFLNGHDIKLYADINTLVQKHFSVLAMTGAGKSYITGNIIEELLDHEVTVVVMDPHGEYAAMAEPEVIPTHGERFGIKSQGYADQLQEFATDTTVNPRARPLRFTLAALDEREIISLTGMKSARTALPALKKVIKELQARDEPYGFRAVIALLERDDDKALGTLLAELRYLEDLGLFVKEGTSLQDLVIKGRMTIINLKGTPPDIQHLVCNRISTALFELRKKSMGGTELIPPLIVVYEEAHNFCPQGTAVASSKILRTIAGEGRKFGLGMGIITQRPAKVDKNVLAQCNTQFILKVTNHLDLKALSASVEGLTKGGEAQIQHLPIGVGLMAGGGLPLPLFIDIRPRKSKHGGESITVV